MKPILFSTPMVTAIIAGRKTMTRRIVKFPKDWDGKRVFNNAPLGLKYGVIDDAGNEMLYRLYPKYEVGDVLWVRESFTIISGKIHYKADLIGVPKWEDVHCKPSIFMPYSACRIWLEVTDVRAERLQDISEHNCKEEGVELQLPSHLWKNYHKNTEPKEGFSNPNSSYESLWREINGNNSWASNPWVWVYGFKVKEILK